MMTWANERESTQHSRLELPLGPGGGGVRGLPIPLIKESAFTITWLPGSVLLILCLLIPSPKRLTRLDSPLAILRRNRPRWEIQIVNKGGVRPWKKFPMSWFFSFLLAPGLFVSGWSPSQIVWVFCLWMRASPKSSGKNQRSRPNTQHTLVLV